MFFEGPKIAHIHLKPALSARPSERTSSASRPIASQLARPQPARWYSVVLALLPSISS